MSEKKRVVITGAGVVSPIAVGVKAYWKALQEKKNGIGQITLFDTTDFPCTIGGQIQDADFDVTNYVDVKEAKRMQRYCKFSSAAACLAVHDSGANFDQLDRERVGVLIGCGIGGLSYIEDQKLVLHEKGPKRVNPFLVPMIIADMPSGLISIQHHLYGPNSATVTACASSNNAMGEAFNIIRRGAADMMVTGGTESAISPLGFAGFCAMRALSTRNDEPDKASRPFSLGRDGFVMGEGSGIVIIESLAHAVKRGAEKIYGEIVGYGMSGDGHHISAPDPDGMGAVRSMRRALEDGGVSPDMVRYINAHGTSTQLNDQMETNAIRTVFGDHAKKLLISSTKSMTGHLLGGAGGVEMVATLMAVKEGIVHATRNLDQDPALIQNVSDTIRDAAVDYALSNAFGFGGHNATLLVKKFDA